MDLRAPFWTFTAGFFKKHQVVTEEYLGGKVDLILAYTIYSVRRDENGDYVDCDLLESNDVKHLPKVLGDIMKMTAHSRALWNPLW